MLVTIGNWQFRGNDSLRLVPSVDRSRAHSLNRTYNRDIWGSGSTTDTGAATLRVLRKRDLGPSPEGASRKKISRVEAARCASISEFSVNVVTIWY